MILMSDVLAVRSRVRKAYGEIDGVIGFCVNDENIRVFVRSSFVSDLIPSIFENHIIIIVMCVDFK